MRIAVGLILAALAASAQQTTDLGNAEVLAYVNRIGAKLAGSANAYKFAVTANRRSNSTYEPLSPTGGQIFVPAGLILAADDEAEFAGMLAHAMSHKRPAEDTPEASDSTDISEDESKLLLSSELDADAAAIGMMARAGFDPAALARYIERIQLDEPSESATLPVAADRVARMKKAIEELPARKYSEGDEFDKVQLETREAMTLIPASATKDKKATGGPTLIRRNP